MNKDVLVLITQFAEAPERTVSECQAATWSPLP